MARMFRNRNTKGKIIRTTGLIAMANKKYKKNPYVLKRPPNTIDRALYLLGKHGIKLEEKLDSEKIWYDAN